MIGDKAMEKITMFIHNTKDKLKNINDTEYRTVTFIGGNKNIKKIGNTDLFRYSLNLLFNIFIIFNYFVSALIILLA